MCQFLKKIYFTLRSWFDIVVDCIFSLYWDRKKHPIPDLDKKYEFLTESATTLAKKIRERDLKSEDLITACIERMKQVNPLLNAIVDERYNEALQEAREIDKRIAAGISDEEFKSKPFLGVPFTAKECQAVTGLCYTLGLKCRRNELAKEDADCIRLLREAGAIPLAVTNLPEFLIWQETRNMVFGQTNNPHHTGRSPGGSSGGEAALSATFATSISLCSDLGGSTRMPAFYCGLFGHNTTVGVTSLKGMLNRSGDEDSMLALGFISKHVEDIAPLTKIICGNKAQQLNLDREIDIKDIKFYYLESSDDLHCSSMRADLKDAMKMVVTRLTQESKLSHAPEPYYHQGFNHMYTLWRYWMTKEPEDFAKWLKNNQGRANGVCELLKKMFCLSDHTMAAIFKLLDMQVLPKVNAQWAEKITMELKENLFTKLGDNGVLLFPSAPQVTPYHYSCFLRPYNFAYWGILNVLRCPSTQVPLGVNKIGLPLGIQVVAAPYNDSVCLAVASHLEKEFGGYIAACKVQR